jgi:hypothetical protein
MTHSKPEHMIQTRSVAADWSDARGRMWCLQLLIQYASASQALQGSCRKLELSSCFNVCDDGEQAATHQEVSLCHA